MARVTNTHENTGAYHKHLVVQVDRLYTFKQWDSSTPLS